MSRRLKFNVKNISRLQNFSDLFSGREYGTQQNGFSRLVIPRTRPKQLLEPECRHYSQNCIRQSIADLPKVSFKPAEEHTLKTISSELSGKWFNTANFGAVGTPGQRFPWDSAFQFYYDRSNPTCPPPPPKPCPEGHESKTKSAGSSVCPPPKAKPSSDTCASQKTVSKGGPCKRKCTFVVPLNIHRFYSSGPRPCKPRGPKNPQGGGGGSKKSACGPKKSKGGGGGGKKGSVCGPKKSKGGGGGSKKGSVCGPRKSKSGGGGSKRGSVCGSKKSKGGGGGGGKRSVCGGSKKSSSGSGGGKKTPIKYCGPPKKSGGGGGGQKSGGGRGRCGKKSGGGGDRPSSGGKSSKCRPKLEKPKSCGPKKSKTC